MRTEAVLAQASRSDTSLVPQNSETGVLAELPPQLDFWVYWGLQIINQPQLDGTETRLFRVPAPPPHHLAFSIQNTAFSARGGDRDSNSPSSLAARVLLRGRPFCALPASCRQPPKGPPPPRTLPPSRHHQAGGDSHAGPGEEADQHRQHRQGGRFRRLAQAAGSGARFLRPMGGEAKAQR